MFGIANCILDVPLVINLYCRISYSISFIHSSSHRYHVFIVFNLGYCIILLLLCDRGVNFLDSSVYARHHPIKYRKKTECVFLRRIIFKVYYNFLGLFPCIGSCENILLIWKRLIRCSNNNFSKPKTPSKLHYTINYALTLMTCFYLHITWCYVTLHLLHSNFHISVN